MGRKQNQFGEFTYINVKGDAVSNLTIAVSFTVLCYILILNDGK